MTHKPTIQWCADTFGGKVYEKPRKTHKMQYRWRRSFRRCVRDSQGYHTVFCYKEGEVTTSYRSLWPIKHKIKVKDLKVTLKIKLGVRR